MEMKMNEEAPLELSYEDLIKEMFAHFGLAYYHSEAMGRGLGIFYALMSFRDKTDGTNPRLEEKLVEAFSLTLGLVIGKVKPLVSPELQERLDDALVKRNFLAHEFWYERAYSMQSIPGLIEMVVELREYQRIFNEINDEITSLTLQRGKTLGITEELVAEQFAKGKLGEQEPPLPAKKPLGKAMLRVVKAYDVPVSDTVTALVFVTDDHQFLQFCDVGLGWSNYTAMTEQWSPNLVLQQYLPASIVPRPEITAPWNYELKLPKQAVLWVKKGSAEATFRWGIRTRRTK